MIYGKDILFRKHIAEGVEADNGDYIVGEASWDDPIRCDAEPAGKANSITFADGVQRTYSYVISLDVNTDAFQIGDHIMLCAKSHTPDILRDLNGKVVLDSNNARICLQASREYEVKGFHRYAFQCKIWV